MIKGAAIAALAAAAPLARADHKFNVTGTDILNFALQLECLEGEFYSWAAFGEGLSPELLAGGPPSIGGRKANLTATTQEYAVEIANDEINHVAFLRAALGDAAVPCPKMDIGPAFAAAAAAAAGVESLDPTFDPYANDLFFLHGAFIFEDVGVTAYNGAVPAATLLLPPDVVQAAASILGVEAYHAGIVRTLLYIANQMTETPYGPVATVVQLISDLRDSVDGPSDDDQGIVDSEGNANLVPTDDNSLVFARTIPNVLNIVYLGGTEKGGFYPEGINGVFGEYSRDEIVTALGAIAAPAPAPADCPAVAPCDCGAGGAYGGDMPGMYGGAMAPGAACGDLNWPCCAENGPEGGACTKMPGLVCSPESICVEA